MERTPHVGINNAGAPPIFRNLILFSTAILLIAVALVAGNATYTAAQTSTPLVDYDLDDDNLIEVETTDQLLAIHHDLDGDGTAVSNPGSGFSFTAWATAFPNAMPSAGCPLRDHDNDASTDDERECIGYELIKDLNFSGVTFSPLGRDGSWTVDNMHGKFVGNGFRILNPSRTDGNSGYYDGIFGVVGIGSTVEGLGVVNPNFQGGRTNHGGITGELKGTIIGSYVHGGTVRWGGNSGGITGSLRTANADMYNPAYAGKIAHSYARGTNLNQAASTGGLIGNWGANTGTNVGQCINSYFSGTVATNFPAWAHGLIAGSKSGGTVTNCVGDSSTDDEPAWHGSSSSDNTNYRATNANMIAATDYNTPSTNNPFANWEDYDADGTALAVGDTRTDFWDFGDATTLPTLKAWGHDHTTARARTATSVNLCDRTIAVANEIIRLLKDDDRVSGVTSTPAAVTALTDCTASTDTRTVTVANLRDLVVTSESNPLNLSPGRTDPASAKLTALDTNDFAYLPNAAHFNLSGNSFTTLPPRLFQGVPLRWLDLSDNSLTTLHADTFAGMASVTETTGNMLLLNGNALTYTGIADRVFDPLTYLNGLDLSDNALTRVNTRWFEDLVNLGNRPATGADFQDKLGLHLSGNTITQHYYSTKLFTGVRKNVVMYTGSTAGDTLRTAIKAAITTEAGGTTPTTLDIDSTDHFDNTAGTPTYLGVNDTCSSSATAGPAGLSYLGDAELDCYIAPKWSAPYVTGATTTAPTSLTSTPYPTLLDVSTTHTVSTDFVAYQIRHRATPGTPSDPWTQDWLAMPITLAAGTKTATISGLTATTSYQVQIRALSYNAPPSAAFTATAMTSTSPSAPTGLSASTSTDTPAAIALSWTARTLDPGTEDRYEVRSKLSTGTWPATTPFGWAPIAGSDHTTVSHTVTGLTSGSVYDVELRFRWSVAVGSSAAATASATASGVPTPTNFDAQPGSASGEIDLSWDAVTGVTGYAYRCNPSGTGCTDVWQSTTATSLALTSLTPGASYTFELRAITATSQSATPATATATAQTQPGPRSLSATTGSTPGEVDVSWMPPSTGITNIAEYQYRYKLMSAADSEYSTWTQVPDSDNDNAFNDETTLALTGLLGATDYVIQLRVKTTDSPATYSLALGVSHRTSPVPPPTGFTADPGTGPGEIDLEWNPLTGITVLRYEVRYRHSDDDWSQWTGVGTGVDHTLSGLFGGSTYTVELRTVLTGAGPSLAVDATAAPPVLPPPTNVAAATGIFPGQIDLSWDAVASATGYQYRVKTTTTNWPAGGGWVDVDGGSTVTTIIDGLEPDVEHDVELRAMATGIGMSSIETTTATSGDDAITGTAALPTGYAIATADTPGGITITLPGSTDPFMYRTRTANPGEWSRWVVIRPVATVVSHTILGLTPGTEYNVELHVYLGATDGFTLALEATVEALELMGPSDFVVEVSSGILVLKWKNPNSLDAVEYQYRRRVAGTTDWSNWMSVDHEGARGAQQQLFITDVESGQSYQFELKMQVAAGESPVVTGGAISRVSLPEINAIKPEVRELTVSAGQQVRLGVDLYNLQGFLDNEVADDSLLVFRWTEMGAGGGSFGTPNNARRVVYTVPSSPGNYTVQTEAQPDGICTKHHEEATAISAANRKDCIATFTVRVTRAPGVADPPSDPINPAGVIPTSMTDDEGIGYTVFTPVDGGTFIGEGFTVSADAGAVPDRSLLGVNASVSSVPVPAPVPGASMSVAGVFYDINAITQDGTAPLPSYTLDDPIQVCLPFPQEFRADLSNVVLVSRASEGALGILSTKVRTNAGQLTVCGAVSALPATVGVAKLGTVPAIAPTPAPEQPLPDTGGSAPTTAALLLLLTGALLLTAISRIGRMMRV